jgi:hypothetical protein
MFIQTRTFGMRRRTQGATRSGRTRCAEGNRCAGDAGRFQENSTILLHCFSSPSRVNICADAQV